MDAKNMRSVRKWNYSSRLMGARSARWEPKRVDMKPEIAKREPNTNLQILRASSIAKARKKYNKTNDD